MRSIDLFPDIFIIVNKLYMALATHSQFLIAAYVIDAEHENNEFCHWLALQTCALVQEAPYWEKKQTSRN